jgi:hypothetical protein
MENRIVALHAEENHGKQLHGVSDAKVLAAIKNRSK